MECALRMRFNRCSIVCFIKINYSKKELILRLLKNQDKVEKYFAVSYTLLHVLHAILKNKHYRSGYRIMVPQVSHDTMATPNRVKSPFKLSTTTHHISILLVSGTIEAENLNFSLLWLITWTFQCMASWRQRTK